MTEKKLGSEPFFACAGFGDGEGVYDAGASKRLAIATQAMKALLTHNGFYWQSDDSMQNLNGLFPEQCAELSFQYADALLKQEQL